LRILFRREYLQDEAEGYEKKRRLKGKTPIPTRRMKHPKGVSQKQK
jgi:hypothetical protein